MKEETLELRDDNYVEIHIKEVRQNIIEEFKLTSIYRPGALMVTSSCSWNMNLLPLESYLPVFRVLRLKFWPDGVLIRVYGAGIVENTVTCE